MANKKSILVIAVIALIAVGAGVAIALLWEPEPEGLIVGITDLPDSLNPVLPQNLSGLNASELVFDGLVNFEIDVPSGQMSADLALVESITQDPVTKKTYTVVLRDTKWHDGTPVTAADVAYSFAAYVEPENNSPKREYLNSFIESVAAADDKTVTIEFRKPIPEFRAIPVLTFKIIPSTYKGAKLAVRLRDGENERAFATAPVGTGPFQLATWEIGKWLTFKSNATYFRHAPKATSLVLRKIIDPVIRLNEFRKKRINLILETSPLDRPEVEKIANVKLNSFQPYSFYQVAINTKAPLFADVSARKALSAAVDRAALVPTVTDQKDQVVFNNGPFPSNVLSRNFPEYNVESLDDTLPQDAERAKQLAAAAGLDGKGAILLFPDSMGDFGQQMADSLVAQYAKIGLKVEAKRTGDQVFKRLVFTEKNYDLALLYSEGFDNVYSDMGKLFGSNGELNVYGVADKELDAMLSAWSSTVVAADWIAATRRIHAKVVELAPAVFLVSLPKVVYSRGINNVVIASDNPFISVEEWAQEGN
jgi:ABC-type transport system substrate-binding protein